jgi:hypothetical protein
VSGSFDDRDIENLRRPLAQPSEFLARKMASFCFFNAGEFFIKVDFFKIKKGGPKAALDLFGCQFAAYFTRR